MFGLMRGLKSSSHLQREHCALAALLEVRVYIKINKITTSPEQSSTLGLARPQTYICRVTLKRTSEQEKSSQSDGFKEL